MSFDSTYQFPIDLSRRFVITVIVEVIRSNLNGDPNNNGAPRTDRRGFGIASHVSLKRKQRDYLLMKDETVFHTKGVDIADLQKGETRESLLEKFLDLRYFGDPTTGVKGSRIRGPIIVEDGRTMVTLPVEKFTVTRVSSNSGKDAKEGDEKDRGTMGNQYITPYAMYRFNIRFDPSGAKQVGMTPEDMALFWESLIECWEHTRSSSRPGVNLRCVYCYAYGNERGNVPTRVVQDWVKMEVKGEGLDPEDYTITADTDQMPEDMTFHSWVDGITNVITGDGGSRMVKAAK